MIWQDMKPPKSLYIEVCEFMKVRQRLTLNDWSCGEQWILFHPNLNVSQDKVEGNIEIWGKKIHCSPRDQSLSDLLYSKTKQKQILKKCAEILETTSGHLWSCATAVNIPQITGRSFPFDVIVFTMLPARGIWQETDSLIDVMWPWTSQWMAVL